MTGWDDGRGTFSDIGFTIRSYPYFEDGEFQIVEAAFEFPPGEIPSDFASYIRPRGAGLFVGTQWGFVNWNRFGTLRGSATQIISVADYAGKPFEFSAWLASRRDDPGHALVRLELFTAPNASGTSLGSVVFDGNDQSSPFIVGSLNLEGLADPTIPATQDNWTLYRASGQFPLLAESASVVIRGGDFPGPASGLSSSAYVDLVSLQVVPEPASVILLATLIPIVLIWRCATRGLRTASGVSFPGP